MKRSKIILNTFLLVSLFFTYNAFGQWNSGGDNIYYNNGNVGIGKINPSQKLDVNGTIQTKYLHIKNVLGGWRISTNGGGKDLLFRSEPNGGSPETRMYLKQNGNIGIGTSSPTSRLHLQGPENNGINGTLKITSGAQKMVLDGNEIDGSHGIYLNHNLNKNIIMATGGGRVGIGTSSPSSKLHVVAPNYARITMTATAPANDVKMFVDARGSRDNERGQLGTLSNHDIRIYTNSQPRMIVHKSGKIGIGTTSGLNAQLNVRSTGMQLQLNNPNSGGGTWRVGASSNSWAVGGGKFVISKAGSTAGAAIVINQYNSVGIGTPTPNSAYRLSVNGKIRAKEIVVETGWADFVFEDDYKLMPLEEVEAYILAHNHLPDIPSAKDVEENGVSVGEMESKLLQKVEELTLYLIEMKKENAALSQRIQQLEN